VELFQTTPEEIDTAITASRKLNKVLGQSPERTDKHSGWCQRYL
jgi:hypothetical protein